MASLNDSNSNDIYVDEFNIRERANTWPRSQLRLLSSANDSQAYYQISPPTTISGCSSSNLSLISESNESLNNCCYGNNNNDTTNTTNIQHQQHGGAHNYNDDSMHINSPGLLPSYKSGHPSYVELITQAIESSPEKRMTLSEIYDWMAKNVVAFKDQRHLHSSTGWKNSVRHNLSLHSRFKRVKRNGMDKPSWWTVDMSEEIKRDRRHKHIKAGARIRTAPRDSFAAANVVLPQGHLQQRYPAAVGQQLTAAAKLMAAGHLPVDHQPTFGFVADPFAPQMVSAVNTMATAGGDYGVNFTKPADPIMSDFAFQLPADQHHMTQSYTTAMNECCFKEDFPACDFSRNDKWSAENSHQFAFTTAPSNAKAETYTNTCTNNTNYTTIINRSNSTGHSGNSAEHVVGSYAAHSANSLGSYQQPSLSTCSFSGDAALQQQHGAQLQQFSNAIKTHQQQSGTFDGFAQAITINLHDSAASKPSVSLNVQGMEDQKNALSKFYCGQQMQQQSQYSNDYMRQILRIQAINGVVQDVTVPSPIPLKVVINSEKCCQTDDLETDLKYRLQINSPQHVYDRQHLRSSTPSAVSSSASTDNFVASSAQSMPVESFEMYNAEMPTFSTSCGSNTLALSGRLNALENKLARHRVRREELSGDDASSFDLPYGLNPLPAYRPESLEPVFPMVHSFNNGFNYQDNTNGALYGHLNVPIPSWGIWDLHGDFQPQSGNPNLFFGYMLSPTNFLNLSPNEIQTLYHDPRIKAQRKNAQPVSVNDFAGSVDYIGYHGQRFSPLKCRPPLCDPNVHTFATGLQYQQGLDYQLLGKLDFPLPALKPLDSSYRFVMTID